jgi:hypothetical protein
VAIQAVSEALAVVLPDEELAVVTSTFGEVFLFQVASVLSSWLLP